MNKHNNEQHFTGKRNTVDNQCYNIINSSAFIIRVHLLIVCIITIMLIEGCTFVSSNENIQYEDTQYENTQYEEQQHKEMLYEEAIIHNDDYIIEEEKFESDVIYQDIYCSVVALKDSIFLYTIYNNDNKIVKEDFHYGTEPFVTYIDEETIQIQLSAGSNMFYCIYYDIINDRLSEAFESPILVKHGKVLYIDHNNTPVSLIIQDIYNQNEFFEEYFLNFSHSVSPIINAEFIDEQNLYLLYQEGEFFTKNEIILKVGAND